MTRYEKGFLTKCAEHGVPENIAASMLKQAVDYVQNLDQGLTGDILKVRTQLPSGVTTTNGPSGLAVMPGFVPHFHKDAPNRNIDLDPATAISNRYTDPELTPDSMVKLLGTMGDEPRLSPLGTNVVNAAFQMKYPNDEKGRPFTARKGDVGIPRRSQWTPEPYSAEDKHLRTKWTPTGLFKKNLRASPDYDATAAAIQDRYKFLSAIFGSKDKTK